MVKPSLLDLLALIVFGVVLLVADRLLRIERFTDTPCGVYNLGLDSPSCSSELRCINGFCDSDKPPTLKPNMLPVFP
jgi:hypothetical protein